MSSPASSARLFLPRECALLLVAPSSRARALRPAQPGRVARHPGRHACTVQRHRFARTLEFCVHTASASSHMPAPGRLPLDIASATHTLHVLVAHPACHHTLCAAPPVSWPALLRLCCGSSHPQTCALQHPAATAGPCALRSIAEISVPPRLLQAGCRGSSGGPGEGPWPSRPTHILIRTIN